MDNKNLLHQFLAPPAYKSEIPSNKIDSEYRKLRWQVFIGIFIGYAGYYLVRKNLAMGMPELEKMGFDHASLGFALSANAIAYALSKFLMGSISDRSDARKFLPLGLLLASGVTLLMGTGWGTSSVLIMFVLQFMLGWFQGMGWPPCGRIMTHWFSIKERGTKMSVWNCAHNVGGALVGPMAAYGLMLSGNWLVGTFRLPALIAVVIALVSYLLIRDTPQSCGLPSIEKYRNDYPKQYTAESENVLSIRDILFKYVLSNKALWYIACANAFIYMVRYGCLDWAPMYLQSVKGYHLENIGWAYFAYEFAAIPGTLVCGWISDKVFKGRRAITIMIYMFLTAFFIAVYWLNSTEYWGIDILCLIMIGFLIYGPVMLIGVQALDLAPKNAAGTAAGLTGFFGYFFGTALLANICVGFIVDTLGWNWYFVTMIVACSFAILLVSFTRKEENYLVDQ